MKLDMFQPILGHLNTTTLLR